MARSQFEEFGAHYHSYNGSKGFIWGNATSSMQSVMHVKRDLSFKKCDDFPLLPSLMPRISAI